MTKHFFLTATIFFLSFYSQARTSRALLIGIDLYKAPAEEQVNSTRSLWRNLNGCVNDAEAMRDLIIARYGFSSPHITSLLNREATRERIIAELKKLVSLSQKGDVVFIFYAGHGSQMVNSLSVEKDQKDETIVPADSYKGVPDIRDKELAGYFNQLLDKGVVLSVIFDSCHSGSVGRGLFDVEAVRYIEENTLDAKDASDPPKPEERGALILSAAQDFEFAKEIKDENNVVHGAFTMALLKALQQNPVDAPVENIFSSTKAIMKFYGKIQEPVLAANEVRKKQTLFGLPKGTLKNTLGIAVSKADARGVELMGGYAFGLTVGTQLKSMQANDTIVITEMIGANRSMAKPLSSKKTKTTPGALFEVVSWSSSDAPALKVYLPNKGIDLKDLNEAIKNYQAIRSSKKMTLVSDISKSKPQGIFLFENEQWWYRDEKEGKKELGQSLNVAASKVPAGKSAFVNFPPAENLLNDLKEKFLPFNNVEVVASPEESMYALIGTVNEKNELAYAFVKTQVTLQDSTELLPARTDFEIYDATKTSPASIAEKLSENLFRIAKIKDWLMLQPPQGINKFPFALQVQHYHTGKKPEANQVRIGDTLSFYLQKVNTTEGWNRRKRYVYVFSLDPQGAMKLLFPSPSKGNVENRLPLSNDIKPQEKVHLADILVKPPMGTDTYFMLSTEEAITNLSAFQQPGVISRGAAQAKNPLEALLFTGAKSRNKVTTPMTWSIEKIILKTIARKE